MKNVLRVSPLLALLLLPGCSLFQRVAGRGFERPTFTFESWSADQLDFEGVTIALHYRFENPNRFGLDLRRLAYRLEVEGRQIGEGQLPAGVRIAARGATPIAVPVRLRWRDLPGFVELLTTRAEVNYRVSGSASVDTALGAIDLPFEHRDRVALPRVPSFRIEGITMHEASLSSVSLDLRLRIENGNAFPLPVGALTYGLRVGDREVVAGGSHPLVAVPPGGRATISIPVRISVQGMAGAVADLVSGAELRLRGLAGFGDGVEVPVDAPGHVR